MRHRPSHLIINPSLFYLLVGTALLVAVLASAFASGWPAPTQSEATPTSPPPSMGRPPGLILPELPADATQADYGGEAYRLVCSACHGDVGQGLTADWLAQWPEPDQNCWQSKCHSLNHPPDGFELPRYIPPIIGENRLARFGNALALHDYIVATMPMQDPGYLTDEEYWNITAYLLRENGVDPMTGPLSPDLAAQISLDPGQTTPQEGEPLPEVLAEQPATPDGPAYVLAAAILLIVLAAAYLLYRLRKTSRLKEK